MADHTGPGWPEGQSVDDLLQGPVAARARVVRVVAAEACQPNAERFSIPPPEDLDAVDAGRPREGAPHRYGFSAPVGALGCCRQRSEFCVVAAPGGVHDAEPQPAQLDGADGVPGSFYSED